MKKDLRKSALFALHHIQRIIPFDESGGFLPFLPLFPGLPALGTIARGASAGVKAVMNSKNARK